MFCHLPIQESLNTIILVCIVAFMLGVVGHMVGVVISLFRYKVSVTGENSSDLRRFSNIQTVKILIKNSGVVRFLKDKHRYIFYLWGVVGILMATSIINAAFCEFF